LAIISRVSIPELSVVVPSHDRPLRLRWLLNALERQTLERSLWEVVVCHDSDGPETDTLLAEHPLARDGTLRAIRLPAGTAPPGANRNRALGIARARTIVFTDDDCRPPEKWLEQVLKAARANPEAIIQGPIWGDPDEIAMRETDFRRTQDQMWTPRPWAECCNIVYPRELIERVGGFPEDVFTGEDTALHRRALATGARYVGDQAMLTYHAIEETGFSGELRGAWRWRDLPLLFKRHPELREHLPLWLFWKRTHAWLPLALLGARLALRNPLGWLLTVPWAIQRQARAGTEGRIDYLLQMPLWVIIDATEMAAMVVGSVRYRVVIL
jgi:GT2 family glycosyltransferase